MSTATAAAVGSTTIETRNPATGETLASYPVHDGRTVDAKLDAAVAAAKRWRTVPLAERSAVLTRVAAQLRARKSELALLATREMGKPVAEAEAEVEKCAVACEHFAESAERYLASTEIGSNATRSYVAYRPLGVLLAVMPWNFPYWQVVRAAAPALAAGNVIVLKHASNVMGTALELERLFRDAGLPEGAFTTLVIGSHDVERLVLDDRIACVTLTGSEGAGSAIGTAAGKAIKKVVLELGGSDYFLVLRDADLDRAAEIGVKARFQNTGQSCIAAKRFIVDASVEEAFLERFVAKAKALKLGDPTQRETQLGPMARRDLRDEISKQVQATLDAGGRLLCGGRAPDGPGAFYEATVVAGVTPEMTMAREEVFGPAAAVLVARDDDHAVELANDSRYGLGGNVWTRDVERAERLAARLESGNVFINGMTASDPRLPFGGVKKSGHGRELSSFGIHEFVNIQTVWIGPDRGSGGGNGRAAE